MSAIQYTWAIAQMERSTVDDMVQTVHWTAAATDGTYSASSYGSVGLEPADPEEMTPYEDLTPEQVVGWVKDRLGEETVSSTEASLAAQIAEQQAPKQATGLPWS